MLVPITTALALTPLPQQTTVLLCNVPGAPTATVPGLPGTSFQPGTTTSHFDRIYGHPTGHWILTAHADLPTTEDELLLVDGTLVLREGDPAPWTNGTENTGTLDTRCAINARGDFAFATNTSATSLDDYIATYTAGAWSHAAREGDPVPGLPTATLDDSIDSPVLLDDGRVGFAADGIDGASTTTTTDDVLVLGPSLLLREGVTHPPGQTTATPQPIENFDLGDFWASADGTHWIVQGDLEGPTSTDDVVVVDGVVVLQEGTPAPGFTEPIDPAGIFGVSMDVAGHWYARGENDGTNQDWVIRDGVVVAEGGAPIHTGAQELWDDATYSNGYFAHVGNGVGSYVVGGATDHPDTSLDSVLVLDGHAVVSRESDPVDLDGDGLLDDDTYIDAYGVDDLFLTDDYTLLAVVTLKDGTGTRIGQGLVRIDVDPGVGTAFCAAASNSTGAAASLVALGSASVALDDLRLSAASMPVGVGAVFLVGSATTSVPGFGGSQGTLCLAGGVGRFDGPGQFGATDTTGAAILDVELTAIPTPAGAVAGVAGDSWYFQVWYRDHTAAGAPVTNLTNGVEVTLF